MSNKPQVLIVPLVSPQELENKWVAGDGRDVADFAHMAIRPSRTAGYVEITIGGKTWAVASITICHAIIAMCPLPTTDSSPERPLRPVR